MEAQRAGHSFISYLLVQVALEACNSPKVSFSNYRELVKPADAVKWFASKPETPVNVIAVPVGAAAA